MKLTFPLCICLTFVSCTENTPPSEVVARVGGVAVTAEDLAVSMNMAIGNYDPMLIAVKDNAQGFRRNMLEMIIRDTAMTSEARRKGIRVTDADVDREMEHQGIDAKAAAEELKQKGVTLAAWREKERQRIAIRRLIRQEVIEKIPVSDEEVEAFYRQHRLEFSHPAQFHARHILSPSYVAADEIYALLLGGKDFETLARERSQSPDAKRGGDLGWFDEATAPSEFSTACKTLDEGSFSGIIETSYGYHIFQLVERRGAWDETLDEARQNIAERLRHDRSEAVLQQWMNELMQRTEVVIND